MRDLDGVDIRWTGSEGELGGVERENVNQNLLCEKNIFSMKR